VNLIGGRRIAPELMQREVTGEKAAREVSNILRDPVRRTQMKRDPAEVREQLTSKRGDRSLSPLIFCV
jgi:lipid A disaccharide synthetase